MWYEILPSMIIVGLVPVVPQLAAYYINQYFLGNVSFWVLHNITFQRANLFHKEIEGII